MPVRQLVEVAVLSEQPQHWDGSEIRLIVFSNNHDGATPDLFHIGGATASGQALFANTSIPQVSQEMSIPQQQTQPFTFSSQIAAPEVHTVNGLA